MRTNSGSGESKNNNHDPTLRDHERAAAEARDTKARGQGGPSDSREPRK